MQTEMTLQEMQAHAEAQGYIRVRGGKTGKKIHWGSYRGSTLRCGHWLKWEGRHFQTSDDVNCDRCFEAFEADMKRGEKRI